MHDDRAIRTSSQDLLERAPFAADVAGHLTTGTGEEGWVAGLYAKWGEGKSSVLNMIAERLEEDTQALVLRFEPWQFRSSEDLLPRFLGDLADLLRGPHNTGLRQLAKEIEGYAQHLSGELSSLPSPFDTIANFLLRAGHRWLYPPLEKQKEQIGAHLRRLKRRIVILIDDLDRLSPAEACEMLRLVRLVADFPYVRYVLAFDEEIVAHGLEQVLRVEDGKAFLGKMVQVSFILPPPPSIAVRSYVVESVYSDIQGLDQAVDEVELGNTLRAWSNLVAGLGFTLRDAKRLLNLYAEYPRNVLEELNPLDLLLLVTLRYRWPGLYAWLSERKGDLYWMTSQYRDQQQRRKESLEPGFEAAVTDVLGTDTEAAHDLLTRLVPQLGPLWGASWWSSGFEDGWRAKKRLCSSSYFDRYFWFRVPPGEVPDAVRVSLSAFLSSPEARPSLADRIGELRDSYDDESVLDSLEQVAGELDSATSAALVEAMAAQAGGLPAPAAEFRPLTIRARWVSAMARLLVDGVHADAQLSTAAACFESIPLSAANDFLYELRGMLHYRSKELDVRQAVQALVRRIRNQGVTLLDTRELVSGSLWISKTYGDASGHDTLMARLIDTPESAARLVSGYLVTATSMESGDHHPSELRRNSYDDLIEKVDRAALRGALASAYTTPEHRVMWREDSDLVSFAAESFLHMDDLVEADSEQRAGTTPEQPAEGDTAGLTDDHDGDQNDE